MEVVRKIEELLIELEIYYPELYSYLDETPYNVNTVDRISEEDLKEYLEGLRAQLKLYKETHDPVQ